MLPFEVDNVRAYTLLLRIEIVLREYLAKALETAMGPSWEKQLPGDLRKRVKEAQDEEHKPHFDFIRLGPLYYLTFADLLTILQQKLGREAAKAIGGESFLSQLSGLFPARNATCHSRPVSSVGLKLIETLYSQLEVSLTPSGLEEIISNPSVGMPIHEAVQGLHRELKALLPVFPELPNQLEVPATYESAERQFWWADDELAGFAREPVEKVVNLVAQYNQLPSGVGSLALRQTFLEENDFSRALSKAIDSLEPKAK